MKKYEFTYIHFGEWKEIIEAEDIKEALFFFIPFMSNKLFDFSNLHTSDKVILDKIINIKLI